MRESTRTKLSDLLSAYDKAVTRPRPNESDTEAQQTGFQALCREVIWPVMEGFKQALQTYGHQVHVDEQQSSVDDRGITQEAGVFMRITPKLEADATVDETQSAVISFVYQAPEQKIMARVSIAEGAPPHSARPYYSRPHDYHPVAGVTSELVEAEMLEMLHYVLDRTSAADGSLPLSAPLR